MKHAKQRKSYELAKRALKAELSQVTQNLANANQRCEELESAQSTHARLDMTVTGQEQELEDAKQRISSLAADLNPEKEHSHDIGTRITSMRSSNNKITRLEQNLDVADRRISALTANLKAEKEHSHDIGTQITSMRSSEMSVTRLEQDLGVADRRISAPTAELKAEKEHSHDVGTQIASMRSSQHKATGLEQDFGVANRRISALTLALHQDVDIQLAGIQSYGNKVTVLEGDLLVAKERIIALIAELTAAKEHSLNVGTPKSAQLQELEGNIAARDEHLDRVMEDNTTLMDGIQKIKDEDKSARRDMARLKARVASLEKELVDNQVVYEKETKENNARIDRILQLAVPSTSAPTQSSNLVKSKRSSPTAVPSSQKRIKTSDPADTDTIDLTSSDDTEDAKATVQGLVPDAADQTKFTLIPQSTLPQAIQEKVKGWIQKLNSYDVKPGMSPWQVMGNKAKTTCAARRLHRGSSTWIDNNLDRACMDCSKKGYPCIVIRTAGPILLPSHRYQGLPSSDPEYWIQSTKERH